VFYGASKHAIDDKGRIHLPKRLLDRIPEAEWKFVMTVGLDGCLFLFDPKGWDRMVQKCSPEEIGGNELRLLQRSFFANVMTIEPDSQRRIVIPEELKSRVHLETDVWVIGVHNRIEIWPARKWEQYQRDNQSNFELFANQILSGAAAKPPG
jgi:MraZ protein